VRIGSCFSGIDGLALGLEWAGVGHTVWQVEKDDYCRRVLAKHWPDALRFDDVCTVGAHNLPPVDVICGGFPCQDISYAGKGAGLAGARSGLWYEFARIVGEMGPRYVVVENVAALLTRGIDAVLGTLADLGYDAEWSTLRASDVGAPHRRERVFLIAWMADAQGAHGWRELQARGARSRWPGLAGERHELGDADALRELQPERSQPDERGRIRYGGDELGDPTRGGRGAGAGVEVRRPERGRDGVGDAAGERPEPRELATHSVCRRPGERRPPSIAGRSGIVQWADATPVRGADGTVRLIPAEAAAQGPQSPLWPVADGVPGRVARLRAIGNAVVPACAYEVGRRLLEIERTLTTDRAA